MVFVSCISEILPFCHWDSKPTTAGTKNLIKPSLTLTNLINQLNNFTTETKSEPDSNLANCKYKDISYFHYQISLKQNLYLFYN